MDKPTPLVWLIGLATLLVMLWYVLPGSLLRVAELLVMLHPRRRRLRSIVSVLRRIAPRQDDATGKIEGSAGCLFVLVGAWLITGGFSAYASAGLAMLAGLALVPALALLWLCGLAAMSMKEGLEKQDSAPGRDDGDGPADRSAVPEDAGPGSGKRDLATAVRRGCLPDLGDSLGLVAFLLAMLVLFATFLIGLGTVFPPQGNGISMPDWKDKTPAPKPPRPAPHR